MTAPRIVLTTVGSLGDLHPFIAIGLALRRRGADVVLAVPEDYLARVRATGLNAQAVMPPYEEIGQGIGLPPDEIIRRTIADNDFLLRHILLPSLPDEVGRLLRMAEGADAIVGSAVALAAPIAAERLHLPFIRVVLQPMLWFSPHDPPRTSVFRVLKGAPAGPIGRAWNRALIGVARVELRRRFGPALNRVRRANGLRPSREAPMMDPPPRVARAIGSYSPLLGGARAPVLLTGYPWYDRDEDASAVLDPELRAFLDNGPAPLVVSLGSFIPYSDTDLYARAGKAARRLGLRAVLLTGEARVEPSEGVLVRRYAPHSLLFPRATAVMHHGGIGTTGQALRSGRPQLVTPFMADQPDNAARIVRLGAGLAVQPERFSRRGDAAITRLLTERHFADRAAELGWRVGTEDGAAVAADAILSTIGIDARDR